MPASLVERQAVADAGDSLPKRDLILLPLISLLTLLLLVGAAESLARALWAEQTDDACEYYDAMGVRHRAFCASEMKNVEGPWVRYRYNACGYRGTESCGPKAPSVARFAVMGTSIAFGLYVPENQLFSVRSAPALEKILGRRVQFENLGAIGPNFPLQYKMADEVEKLRPEGVFFVLVPFDLKRLDDAPVQAALAPGKPLKRLFDLSNWAYLGRSSRAFFVAQHFLLSDDSFAVRAFLMKTDPDDTAHVPDSPLAEQRYQRVALLLRRLGSDFGDHGIPFYVIALPSRLQAALIGRKTDIPGVDPLAFPHRMAEIARASGAQTIDMVPEFERTPHPERAFYAVDGHLNAFGNQMVANALVDYFRQRGDAKNRAER